MQALIPGINNWNTIGSAPLKRGVDKVNKQEYSSMATYFTDGKLEPPTVPSARVAKYQKLKELENEYFDLGHSGVNDNYNVKNSYLNGKSLIHSDMV